MLAGAAARGGGAGAAGLAAAGARATALGAGAGGARRADDAAGRGELWRCWPRRSACCRWRSCARCSPARSRPAWRALFVALARRQIGGQTGDVCGAAAALAEVATLLALLIGGRDA